MNTRPHPCTASDEPGATRAARRRPRILRVLVALAVATTVAVGFAACDPIVKTAVGGEYSTTYGTAGAVTIHKSGEFYTVTVKTPFKVEGASCELPADTVLATFSGTGPHFTGSHVQFNSSCRYYTKVGTSADLNDDGSVTLTGPTGPHTLVKTANEVPVATSVPGDYRSSYGTVGAVTIHGAGDFYTVSVKTPFKVEGGSCDLPATRVVATFAGSGTSFSGHHTSFNTTCAYYTQVGSTVRLNSDNTITIDTPTGPHLYTKTADQTAVAPTLSGNYWATYATTGAVGVSTSGTTATVTVKSPLRIEGASCDLPVNRTLATFSGTGTAFSGVHSSFDATTCAYYSQVGSSVHLNSDNSITIDSPTGPHLYTRI